MMFICDWCKAKAKYEINESKACGRHLAAAVDYQTSFSSSECRVRKIEEGNEE